MILRRDVYKLLGDNLILKVNPEAIKNHAPPPLYSWSRKKFLIKKRYGKVISRIILLPYTSLFVYSGKWDLSAKPFKEYHTYINMLDLYRNKNDFRNSLWYKNAKRDIEQDGRFIRKDRSFTSLYELDTLFEENLLDILISMEETGYENNKAQDSCGVMISRSGELIKSFGMGNHRLAAAQLVGLKSIPVTVTRVHKEWFKEVGGGWKGIKLQKLKYALSEVETEHS